MRDRLIAALAEQGIHVTEAELADLVHRARQTRTLICEVSAAVYSKWEEIQFELRTGEIDTPAAHARFESEVYPHLGIRRGVDYDPRIDTINIVPRRTVRSIHTPERARVARA